MKTTRITLLLLTGALVAGGATAGAAQADSVAYIKGGDVYLSTSDGARQFQVTSSGGYDHVSQADDGTLLASTVPGAHLRRLDRLGNVLSGVAAAQAAKVTVARVSLAHALRSGVVLGIPGSGPACGTASLGHRQVASGHTMNGHLTLRFGSRVARTLAHRRAVKLTIRVTRGGHTMTTTTTLTHA